MRSMRNPTLAPALLVSLALGACSSNDDDAPSGVDGVAAGPDGTSMLNPDLRPEAPPSSEPGGDTSAIAGVWDATRQVVVSDADEAMTVEDEAYVQISEDGLWTHYDYDQDGAGSPEQGNCYRIAGPFTLTPEGGTDYSLAGEEDAWTLSVGDDVLSAQLGDGEAMSWPRAPAGLSVEDFMECAVAPGETSEPDER